MLRAGVGLSTERDSSRAAGDAAEAAMRSGGLDRADVVLAFATTAHGPGFTSVTRTAAEVCGTRDVVGCSAAGVLAGDHEVESGPGVALLAIGGDVVVRRFFVPLARGGERAAAEVVDAIGGASATPAALVLFADSYNLEPDALLQGLARALPGVPVIGGGASEDGSVGQVAVFSGDAVGSNAVSGVSLQGVRATIGVAQALRKVGPVHRVTAVRGRSVLALDGRPAYDAFAAIVPVPLRVDLRRALATVLVGISVGETDYVARHLTAVDPDAGTLSVAAPVGEGQELFFGVRDPGWARDDLRRMLDSQAAEWQGTPAAAGLYVNCVGRGRRFHGVAGLDTAYITQQLGSVPVAGFFSGAEFAPAAGSPRLHQYSGVLTMLGVAT